MLIFLSNLFLVPIFTYVYIKLGYGKDRQRYGVMISEF